ncbi:hypothetical protein [Erwinia amylovora]
MCIRDRLDQLRRHILSCFTYLPVAGEYMHRDAFCLLYTSRCV